MMNMSTNKGFPLNDIEREIREMISCIAKRQQALLESHMNEKNRREIDHDIRELAALFHERSMWELANKKVSKGGELSA